MSSLSRLGYLSTATEEKKKKITTVINWKLECQFLNWGLVSRNTGLRFSVGDSFTP